MDTAYAAITELARQRQVRLSTQVIKELARAVDKMTLTEDGVNAFLVEAVQAIAAGNRASMVLAEQQYAAYRVAAGLEPQTFTVATSLSLSATTGAMVNAGPAVMRKALAAGFPKRLALATTKAAVGRIGKTLALNGGRDQIIGAVQQDRQALGWGRRGGASTCSFCRRLISRGPVYKSEQTSSFQSHRGCGCSAFPVFDRANGWTAQAHAAKAQWAEANGDPKEFRRLIEGRSEK